MKSLIILLLLPFLTYGQNCPELKGILVNSCEIAINQHGYNEFIVVNNGNANLNRDSIKVHFPVATDGTQNVISATSTLVNNLNTASSCPGLFEVSPLIIPPKSKIIIFSSKSVNFYYNFINLCDYTKPIYVLTANNTSSNGKFSDGGCSGGTRTFGISFGIVNSFNCNVTDNLNRLTYNCSDSVANRFPNGVSNGGNGTFVIYNGGNKNNVSYTTMYGSISCGSTDVDDISPLPIVKQPYIKKQLIDSLTIYPIPFKDYFYIKHVDSIYQVTLFDNKMSEIKLVDILYDNTKATVNYTDYPVGVLFIRITTKNNVIYRKILRL